MTEDRINILVVDDVPDKLVALEAILEDLGQNVVSVGSGREALRQLLSQDFALILLDVNMPDMDGFETASLIRQRKRSENTPIIFITGFSDETHVARGYSLGAVDYILTPVVPEVLRAKVAVFVELYRKSQQVRRQAEQQVAIAHEQAARAAAEEASRRYEFLSRASATLAASLDYEATLAQAAALAVPLLGDVCVIDGVEDKQRQRRPAIACARHETEILIANRAGHPLGPEVQSAVARVIKQHAMERLGAARLSASANDVDRSPDLPPLPALASALVLPLMVGGKARGTMTLARFLGRERTAIDEPLARELADRVAIALDNAALVRKIQEADHRKDEFLATLGHELRNPLAAISNALVCLDLGDQSGALLDDARDILKRQVRHMVRLVDDLLDVSRITRGKVRLRKEVLPLSRIIEQAAAGARPMIDEREHDLTLRLPDEPLYVFGDATRLEQIVGNLLHNAAKYTDPGGRITVELCQSDGTAEIRVRDTGAGIASDLLPKVFDLFAQGDRTLANAQGGLGIGLTLVRSLVLLHDGEVTATSAGPGQGSEFVVHLPLVQPPVEEEDTAGTHSATAPALNGAPKSRQVLIVDDNVDLAKTTAALLKSLGHEVQLSHSGADALELLSHKPMDVAVVDIGMPDMTGYQLARAIRESIGSSIRLIALTGYGQAEDRRRSLEAGFDIHLVKPVSIHDLMAAVAATQVEPTTATMGA